MQQHWLGVGSASLHRVHLRIDVSVGHEQIEPAVVVHVEKRRAPPDQRQAGLAEMRSHGYVFESSRALILISGIMNTQLAIKRFELLRKVCDEHGGASAGSVVPPDDD